MNEEYLWSRKGSDTAIEKLETLLSGYRFKEGTPPALIADNIVQVKPAASRRFAWLTAFAATAAVLAALWIVNLPVKRLTENAALPVADLPSGKPIDNSFVAIQKAAEPKQLPMLKTLAKPRIVKTIYRTHASSRVAPTTIARQPKLTQEEKYAYGRLMLALSITSSKLKIVQDTIDRKVDADQGSIRNEK